MTVALWEVSEDLEVIWNGAMYRAGLVPGLSTWPEATGKGDSADIPGRRDARGPRQRRPNERDFEW